MSRQVILNNEEQILSIRPLEGDQGGTIAMMITVDRDTKSQAIASLDIESAIALRDALNAQIEANS